MKSEQLHFDGPVWRPPYEANSVLIQTTIGCSHNKCKFCSLYPKDLKFRIAPTEEFDADLQLIKKYKAGGRRVFLTGSNPFVLSYNRLVGIALKIRRYIPECESIGGFSRITDIRQKSVEQLRELRHLGYDRITIGIETGDDSTLAYMNKGYTAKDALEQCLKLEEAGIEYHFIILNGLAGKGNGIRNATESARLFNQIHPSIINITSLTIFPESELYQDVLDVKFEEASEVERLEEMKTLIANLDNPVTLLANTVSNTVPISGILPKDKQALIRIIDEAISDTDEKTLGNYRKSIWSL